MSLADLPPAFFESVLEFLVSVHKFPKEPSPLSPWDSCIARVNLQLTCRKLAIKLRNKLPCFAPRRTLTQRIDTWTHGANWSSKSTYVHPDYFDKIRFFNLDYRNPDGELRSPLPSNLLRLELVTLKELSKWKWPPTLRSLCFEHYRKPELIPSHLPDSLTSLTLRNHVVLAPDSLPRNLKHLCLSGLKFASIDNVFPSGLVSLEVLAFDDELTPGFLPPSLRILRIELFNKQLQVGALPPSLRILSLPNYNNSICEAILPSKLEKLSLAAFNRHITPGVLPAGLKSLEVMRLSEPFSYRALPQGLRWLKCSLFPEGLNFDYFRGITREEEHRSYPLNKKDASRERRRCRELANPRRLCRLKLKW